MHPDFTSGLEIGFENAVAESGCGGLASNHEREGGKAES
jgi:hypothetical protein